MTKAETELRELELWMAANVMGQAWFRSQNRSLSVLAKCAEKCSVRILAHGGGFLVARIIDDGWDVKADAETLPLAISKFAKLIFSVGKI